MGLWASMVLCFKCVKFFHVRYGQVNRVMLMFSCDFSYIRFEGNIVIPVVRKKYKAMKRQLYECLNIYISRLVEVAVIARTRRG